MFAYPIELTVLIVIHEREVVIPGLFIQIHEHPLLKLIVPAIDNDGIVVPVEAVDQGLDGGSLQMTHHGIGLAGPYAHHQQFLIDQSERIHHYFA